MTRRKHATSASAVRDFRTMTEALDWLKRNGFPREIATGGACRAAWYTADRNLKGIVERQKNGTVRAEIQPQRNT